MPETVRISPDETQQRVVAGKALLVCAYTEYTKFLQYRLEGAIALSDLHAGEDELPRDREIIFYCN